MDEEFLKAFAEVVREQVVCKNKIEIDGIGSFYVEHQKQFQKQYDNGRVVMMPPKDEIRFIPEE
ncbi:HU family DNA-binding protein [Fodinibius salsisoli]|uniref:HU family DNA-binding protein n=1 Tax=Fodinibius salsisoli TaxID=2820877 RepID=A0ABT3PRE8_9BACT|nr:HU family DNA-binding protein [Fodinibius salsisoli]MCW9708439.1 HU family DNA-binding protein [Fodinibius salsisoli]